MTSLDEKQARHHQRLRTLVQRFADAHGSPTNGWFSLKTWLDILHIDYKEINRLTVKPTMVQRLCKNQSLTLQERAQIVNWARQKNLDHAGGYEMDAAHRLMQSGPSSVSRSESTVITRDHISHTRSVSATVDGQTASVTVASQTSPGLHQQRESRIPRGTPAPQGRDYNNSTASRRERLANFKLPGKDDNGSQ